MAVLRSTPRNAMNRNNTRNVTTDESEFAGLWINVGVITEEDQVDEADDEPRQHFNRLPRGIAVADLVPHRIYANSAERNPEWAAEAQIVNQLIDAIREKSKELKEGESLPMNFSVQLYRRQEQVEEVSTPPVDINMNDLFG